MKTLHFVIQKGIGFGWLPSRFVYGAALYAGWATPENNRPGFRFSVLVYDDTYNRAIVWTWWPTRPEPKEKWLRGWNKVVVGKVL